MIDDISHLSPAMHPEKNYRVVYRGQLLKGHSAASVETELRQQFSMSDKQISAFLSMKKFIVRKGMPRNKAAKLRSKLRQIGLDVVANSPRKHAQPENTAKRPTSNIQVTAKEERHQETSAQLLPTTKSRRARWITIGASTAFTIGVVWLFFSI